MRLKKFRVTNFRSVEDSGWIDCDSVTTLVGTNEAGKSNLLLALWKMKPARDGEIVILQDMPRSRFSEWRNLDKPPKFIECLFECDDKLIGELQDIFDASPKQYREVKVSRDFKGIWYVEFPNGHSPYKAKAQDIASLLSDTKKSVEGENEKGKGESGYKASIISRLDHEIEGIKNDYILASEVKKIIDSLKDISRSPLKTSLLSPIVNTLINQIQIKYDEISAQNPQEISEIRQKIVSEMPDFVYYSNYGNLDSEIYLPHVVENLKREDLSGIMSAKARTLRVLFDFVNLNPEEILELGEEYINKNQYQQALPLTDEKIQEMAEKKKERDVLLQSASARLSKEFRDWWKQGDYHFRFAADGSHFRIWVSDDSRPDEVELEGRSTGLQWFLSFYLVFLVESNNSHKGSILLLDEAGQSLHPLAQKDLAAFFDNLSKKNQIIHTTHSPFLISPDNINRARVVYADESGHTVASSDLKAGNLQQSRQGKSVYAVHAALGLSVSEMLLQGCMIVIVEGPSDQYYLSAIKTFLLSEKLISPVKEIVFVPSGGVRGVASVASILSSKDDDMPYIIVDSDKSGKDLKNKIVNSLYSSNNDKILEIGDFLDMENAEVEDIMPVDLIISQSTRLFFRSLEQELEDNYSEGQPIIGQIEEFASESSINLEIGWKVELARQVKEKMSQQRIRSQIPDNLRETWQRIFKSFE